jgi:EAL domain-containing protein (putative c-di-GMP-specific phosphodiesterase class I)
MFRRQNAGLGIDLQSGSSRRRGRRERPAGKAGASSDTLLEDLRWALERDELRLHWQTIVELDSGSVVGAEALLRWMHPQRGMVLPDDFVPLACETGLIVPIGEWVIERVCSQLERWAHDSVLPRGFVASINVSAPEIEAGGVAHALERALVRTGRPASDVCLEVTERQLVQDTGPVVAAVEAVSAVGAHLALDDFGIGHSSLAVLKRLPVDSVKIDRSFVAGLDAHGGRDAAIVGGVVGLAHGLGLSVTAEGVETEAQCRHTAELGCDQAQGFYFARPQPAEAMTDVLAQLVAEESG